MTLSLNSKEGRGILDSLADTSAEGSSNSALAGRNLGGSLGFRLVRFVRQFFQSPDAYQDWLNEQRTRVAREFIAICKSESSSSESVEVRFTREGRALDLGRNLSPSSLDMLRSQTNEPERRRVLTPKEFEKLLTPQAKSHRRNKRSGFQRLIDLINPFDESTFASKDWIDQFRASGQALKIEMSEMLDSYYDLLQSNWNPADVNVWASIGAHLIRLNDDLTQLCQSAEELLLSDMAKEAGFNLTLIFALLKGLSSEKSALAYLVAHPQLVQGVKNWDEAITKVRAG